MKRIALKGNTARLAFLSSLREAPAGQDAPGEFQIFPEGEIEMEGIGKAILDEEAGREIVARFERRGIDMVVDYEHQTLDNVEAPAAGWIKRLVYRAKDGLYAAVEWTEKARAFLQNREYRYFSPVIAMSPETGRITQILCVALTNLPKTNHLRPIMAKLSAWPNFEEEEETMEKLLSRLKKLLGLAPEATEDEIGEAVAALAAKAGSAEGKNAVACKEVLDALGAREGDGKDEVVRIIAALKSPAGIAPQLSQQVAVLSRELRELRRDDLTALALKEGKTSPEELDKWGRDLAETSPEQFKVIVLSRPAGSVIPVGGIAPAPRDRNGVLDENQRRINAMVGVSDEAFRKYNQ